MANHLTFRLIALASMLLLLLGIALRLALLWMLPDYFERLSGMDVLTAMAHGLRYDLALLLLILLPPLSLISLPGMLGWQRCARYLGYWLLATGIAASVILGIASLQFFTFFNRHLGIEIQSLFSDFDFILQLAVEQHSAALFGVLLVLLAALLLSIRWLPKIPAPQYGAKPYGLGLALILILAVAACYQPLAGHWTNLKLAFDISADSNQEQRYRHSRLGQLVLNPAYEGFRGLLFPPPMPVFKDAASGYVVINVEANASAKKTASQSRPSHQVQPNIVLVILESWTPDFIGAYGAEVSVTPEFDKIAAQGKVYRQAYANGPLSIYGLQALLTGVAHLPGMPLMGVGGIESKAVDGIANVLAAEGYETFWAQAPRRASFNMDWLAQRWGYQHIAGKEQYHTPADWVATPFGWDWPMYEYALDKLPSLEPPFFATLYTAVTHIPYVEVPEPHRVAAHQAEGVGGYKNTLSRADWALGKFWQQAQQQPWHDDTVYIFVADHVVPKFMPDKTVKGRFRIPLLVVGAEQLAIPEDSLLSQLDILPMVQHISGAKPVNTKPHSGVLLSNAPSTYWITKQRVLARISDLPEFIETDNSIETGQQGAAKDPSGALAAQRKHFRQRLEAAYSEYSRAPERDYRRD